MSETAIHSSETIFHTFKKLQKPPEPEKDQELEEELIAQLDNDPRWMIVQKYIDGLIEMYSRLPISETDTVAQVGYRYLVAENVRTALQSIRNLPATMLEAQKDGNKPTGTR